MAHDTTIDSSQCEFHVWSEEFDIQVANYSDISCQTFNDVNYGPMVVISGPHGTDFIDLKMCYYSEGCTVFKIENGNEGGARY